MANIPVIAAAWAKTIALDNSHGYSQYQRDGPNYDCSSLVITAYKQAGLPLTCTYTGNMRYDFVVHGFTMLSADVPYNVGDVLLNDKTHTAIVISATEMVEACCDENGGIGQGAKTGDQTGNEIKISPIRKTGWDVVLRYIQQDNPEKVITYIVQNGDTLWAIAQKYNTTVNELATINNIVNPDVIHVGDKLTIRRVDNFICPYTNEICDKYKR